MTPMSAAPADGEEALRKKIESLREENLSLRRENTNVVKMLVRAKHDAAAAAAQPAEVSTPTVSKRDSINPSKVIKARPAIPVATSPCQQQRRHGRRALRERMVSKSDADAKASMAAKLADEPSSETSEFDTSTTTSEVETSRKPELEKARPLIPVAVSPRQALRQDRQACRGRPASQPPPALDVQARGSRRMGAPPPRTKAASPQCLRMQRAASLPKLSREPSNSAFAQSPESTTQPQLHVEIGETVQIWSNSESKWIADAVITKVLAAASVEDGQSMPAGSVHVKYGGGLRTKWLLPQHIGCQLQRSQGPSGPLVPPLPFQPVAYSSGNSDGVLVPQAQLPIQSLGSHAQDPSGAHWAAVHFRDVSRQRSGSPYCTTGGRQRSASPYCTTGQRQRSGSPCTATRLESRPPAASTCVSANVAALAAANPVWQSGGGDVRQRGSTWASPCSQSRPAVAAECGGGMAAAVNATAARGQPQRSGVQRSSSPCPQPRPPERQRGGCASALPVQLAAGRHQPGKLRVEYLLLRRVTAC